MEKKRASSEERAQATNSAPKRAKTRELPGNVPVQKKEHFPKPFSGLKQRATGSFRVACRGLLTQACEEAAPTSRERALAVFLTIITHRQ